jgi:hypothetical protein
MQTTASAAEAPFIDACAEPGHTTILAGSDDGSMRITLPFPFRYWATDLAVGAMINVCSNGWIGMDGSTICSLSGTIPSTSTPNAMIAPHWGDLVQRGGICIATVGTAPYRQLVIQWDDSTYFPLDDGAHNTFEIVLHETTGTIDLIFESMMATDAHTTGIEDQTGGMGLNACPAGTGTCAPLTGQRIRFLPIP